MSYMEGGGMMKKNQGDNKRYKHKITYWLPSVIYILLVTLWFFCPNLPINPIAMFFAVLMGGFVIREIGYFFKDWGNKKNRKR